MNQRANEKKNGFADSVLLPRKKKVKEEMYESKCMLALVLE